MCDFCTRSYHVAGCEWRNPIEIVGDEFKCDVCKYEIPYEEAGDKEDTSLRSSSLSNVSKANTVSNEQTPASLGGEETSDELQSNFESRLSDLLGQIHTESVDTTPASLGGKIAEEYIKSWGGTPKLTNELLMKAIGIEEETPPDTAETREEEDTSLSLSSSLLQMSSPLQWWYL